ncbi:MAG: S-adenosylmethionine decarboxylase [Acidobacteria bacterium]|nr:S-adenosylmethionine decarboxylase [Acidobacteriota bacterium]
MIVGTEWLIEAEGCDPAKLRNEEVLRGVFDRISSALELHSLGSVWHKFDGEGGITGIVALTESHFACHTYPEYRTATFNLYCCRSRPEWDWNEQLAEILNAESVTVTRLERGDINKTHSQLSKPAGGGAQ